MRSNPIGALLNAPSIISELLNVPSTDPDDARRGKLLNILLLGVGILALLTFLAALIVGVADARYIFFLSPIMLVAIALMFAINRYVSGALASSLFVLLFTIAIAFADEPENVVNGRALFLFTIPILMASVVLRPWASFLMAGVSSLVITVIELFVLNRIPGVPSMLGFFAFALVSWLSARSLEGALADLRVLNRELDQRVVERTRDLAEALSRNQAILDGIADGVIVFDLAGRASVVNPAISSLLHRSAGEIVGRRIDALMAEDVLQEDREIIAEILQNSHQETPSFRLEWADKTFSTSFAPVHDNFGRITGMVAVFRDFTREAELERMKSAFVSRVSHELRTPLNAIMGYADMLKEEVYGPVTDKQEKMLGRMIVNSKRQLSIINDLLDQAQIEAGTMRIRVAPFVPSDLIVDVVDVMAVLAEAKGLELAHHIADSLPDTVTNDRQRLHQVLVNLVGNAIKFTDEGRVDVRAYRANASNWALEISDTGCGIPVEARSYIFEPFRQVGDLFTRKHAGSGLGLSIARQLTHLMGGEITVESQVNRGSTFTVTLPLVPVLEEIE
ncbi:MAG TPA: PAS domain S-box protein [Chloroflexi bacterium]|nr:PAS domain S-box protein [Chloroflexota bacterium]